MASTNDLKNGMVLSIDNGLWAVVEFQHVKPGKGPAFVRTKLKNVETNKTVDRTFNAGTKVETASVDRRTMQDLYNDGSNYVFMDTGTYDQLEIDPAIVGDAKNFLLENNEAIVATNDGRVLFVELPASVEMEITFTEPGLAGDSATGRTKPATLETGHEVQVPLFVNAGDRVKVQTASGDYMSRA
jgi:elongation factor P